MANIKSAQKRILVTRKKTANNRADKTELATAIKKFKSSPTAELYSVVTSMLDKAAGSNIIHANKANRVKAQLAALVKTA
jgi:small subunit ribosomal protein S20